LVFLKDIVDSAGVFFVFSLVKVGIFYIYLTLIEKTSVIEESTYYPFNGIVHCTERLEVIESEFAGCAKCSTTLNFSF
jgi:hypothetical protein